MPTISQDLWDRIVAKRGKYCELCNWREATAPHHCIVKQKKKHPEYDVEENIELVCDECHIWGDGYVNSYQHKVGFWERQKKRGYNMKEWYDSLNLKHKEFFE